MVAVAWSAAAYTTPEDKLYEGFEPLFNGKDLTG